MANQSNKSPFGVGHDGRPKGVPAAPGMHGPARGADAFKGHHVPGNIARDGAPKNHHDVPMHRAMTRQQTNMAGVGGMHSGAAVPSSIATPFDANPSNPMSKEPRGKVLSPVQPSPGMRSRTGPIAKSLNDPMPPEVRPAQPGVNHARGQANKPDLKNLGAAVLAEALCNK